MMTEIRAAKILGSVRGMARVDRALLARAIVAVGRAATENPDIAEIDINPLIVAGSRPIAVDGLVILDPRGEVMAKKTSNAFSLPVASQLSAPPRPRPTRAGGYRKHACQRL